MSILVMRLCLCIVTDPLRLDLPGFIIFIAVIWVLQELTKVRILRYVILFIGMDYPVHPSLHFNFGCCVAYILPGASQVL